MLSSCLRACPPEGGLGFPKPQTLNPPAKPLLLWVGGARRAPARPWQALLGCRACQPPNPTLCRRMCGRTLAWGPLEAVPTAAFFAGPGAKGQFSLANCSKIAFALVGPGKRLAWEAPERPRKAPGPLGVPRHVLSSCLRACPRSAPP